METLEIFGITRHTNMRASLSWTSRFTAAQIVAVLAAFLDVVHRRSESKTNHPGARPSTHPDGLRTDRGYVNYWALPKISEEAVCLAKLRYVFSSLLVHEGSLNVQLGKLDDD